MSPLPKRAKRTYLAMDKDKEVIGYVIPVHDVVRGLMEAQEEVTEEGINYVAMRNLFVREAREAMEVKVEKKTRSKHVRESAERLEMSRTMEEWSEFRKKMNPDSLTHRPEFIVKPRGQTVWEGKDVKLHCTVAGWPKPRIAWYKNNVLIDAKAHSEKYTAESNYNMHSLEIKNCDFFDTAKYHISALNVKGEASAVASVVVKSSENFEDETRLDADVEVEGVPVAPLDVRCHDANKDYVVVTWKQPAVEGSSSILGYYIDRCEVGTHHWARCNEVPVKYARFPVTGLVEGRSYVFRVRAVNKAGVSHPSRVSEAVVAMDPSDRARLRAGPSAPWTGMIKFTEEDPTVGVVPGEPTDVVVTEATKSYVVLAWKPPAQRGHEGVMYYIEKRISGTDTWQRVNTGIPVKSPRFALFDLAEGKSYSFRVRCCNSAGVGEASESTGEVIVGDKLDLPSAPGNPVATRNTDTSVVVSWGASKDVQHLVGYYIECSVVGTDVWMPCNNKPVRQTRFVCHGLITGANYVFKVKAVNAAGYSQSSPNSDAVVVQAAISVPGKPTGVTLQEAFKDYMVLGWNAPANNGGADIRGYFVDYRTVKGGVAGKWHEMNHQALTTTSYKVTGLKGGASYVFHVRAQNLAGVGKPSAVLGPILAQTRPGDHRVFLSRLKILISGILSPFNISPLGTKEIYVDVDDDGVISMVFECSEMMEGSEFVWSKNYKEITDTSRLTIISERGKSRAIFNSPSLEDLGTFSCVVTNTDGISSSYTLTEEGLKRLLDISHDHKFPVIPFKNEMAMELLEKGRVRFWTQVEKCTSDCQVEYVFNDVIISQGKKYIMNFDKSSGIIEMFMDSLEVTDEGTFTFNLVDGKAKGTTSLVLIGDGKELQKKSEFARAEWVRKQGPHFVEYLDFSVTPECDVLLKCKVIETNVNNYSAVDISSEVEHIGKLQEMQISACLCSFLPTANSSSEIKVLSTEHGIVLYSTVTYYHEDLRVGWLHKYRVKSGVTGDQLWLKINEPTEKDKGKYSMDIFDGKDGVKRAFDLTGQAWEEAFEEFQRLNIGEYNAHELSLMFDTCTCISCLDRARVVGGLPDVVAIQEGKSLNLTGNVWGEPVPEVSWTKNEKVLVSDDHYKLKFEHNKFASITIAAVSTADSGKYALVVKNKYGTEAGEFTVSVYNPEEEESKEEKKD
uniref:Myomesin 1a (skelemin) n=1 Tax=Astatotilapia calliptera TaxID=8154 RepID=A0AAX7SLD2_ASTCA